MSWLRLFRPFESDEWAIAISLDSVTPDILLSASARRFFISEYI